MCTMIALCVYVYILCVCVYVHACFCVSLYVCCACGMVQMNVILDKLLQNYRISTCKDHDKISPRGSRKDRKDEQ